MHPQPGYGLDEVIATLPSWITTSAFEPYAALKIRSSDTAALSRAYRNLFLAEWPRLLPSLNQRFGITSWKAFVSIGPHEFELDDDFATSRLNERAGGGLRIVLTTAAGTSRAFLWMRPSGTEPLFRIAVDIEGGSSEDEAWLRSVHTDLVTRADVLALQDKSTIV